MNEWNGFKGTKWQKEIDVAGFIASNYKEYRGDKSFLKGVSSKHKKFGKSVNLYLKKKQ